MKERKEISEVSYRYHYDCLFMASFFLFMAYNFKYLLSLKALASIRSTLEHTKR